MNRIWWCFEGNTCLSHRLYIIDDRHVQKEKVGSETYERMGPDLQSKKRQLPIMRLVAEDTGESAYSWKESGIANRIFFLQLGQMAP